MLRVVLDTNMIISSALGGALRLILDKWDENAFTVITSTEIMNEYLEVIHRPKFKFKQEFIDKTIAYVYQFAEFVIPEETLHVVDADPKDDKFLEAALAGHADCIVTGDNHLLALSEFRGIPIITGRAFLEQLARA